MSVRIFRQENSGNEHKRMTDFFCRLSVFKPHGLINGNLPADGRRGSATLFGEQAPCGSLGTILCEARFAEQVRSRVFVLVQNV